MLGCGCVVPAGPGGVEGEMTKGKKASGLQQLPPDDDSQHLLWPLDCRS
jgi:hypothetical protein